MKLQAAQSSELAKSLKKSLTCEVLFDEYQRALYSTDASIYQIVPAGVVLPRTRDDVVAAVQFAKDHDLALVPRGGGTSLSGQSIGAGLILDFSKYMRAIDIDRAIDDRARRAWRRARPAQRRRRAHGLAIRPRRGHQQPR